MKSLVMTSGLFWPILASLLTMTTSTMHQEPGGSISTGCANSENTHHYLIHQREKRASYEIDDEGNKRPKVCAKGDAICIPANYSKFDLPDEELTTVNVGIDIKDIPKIDDKEFSITLNAFFVVRWTDARMIIDQVRHSITQKINFFYKLHLEKKKFACRLRIHLQSTHVALRPIRNSLWNFYMLL